MGKKTISLAQNGVFWWHMQNPNNEKVKIHKETGAGHFSLFEKKVEIKNGNRVERWVEHENDTVVNAHGALVECATYNTSTNEWAIELVGTGIKNKFDLTAHDLDEIDTSWNPTKPPAT